MQDKIAIDPGLSHNPKYVADQIIKIVRVMISRMSVESQQKAVPNLRNKIRELNSLEISQKKQIGGSSIGVSLGLVKNILNGRDPYFISLVLDEVSKGL